MNMFVDHNSTVSPSSVIVENVAGYSEDWWFQRALKIATALKCVHRCRRFHSLWLLGCAVTDHK